MVLQTVLFRVLTEFYFCMFIRIIQIIYQIRTHLYIFLLIKYLNNLRIITFPCVVNYLTKAPFIFNELIIRGIDGT